jgi:hypothetical protein
MCVCFACLCLCVSVCESERANYSEDIESVNFFFVRLSAFLSRSLCSVCVYGCVWILRVCVFVYSFSYVRVRVCVCVCTYVYLPAGKAFRDYSPHTLFPLPR